ncbi:hypothetical protein [Marisediminicola senii]|uniref:hypothetical protein n=1 Tax=Marisediminicola senii TaxID=2711233 RepID=UPI0013EAE44C|nr:hypothetical protein [Marisediminicola senii]
MTVDLRWLTAPADEVASAMARVRRGSRPRWMPTRRQVLVHVNHCLLLWYLFFVLMTFGIRVDVYQDGRVLASDIGQFVITAAVLAAWLFGTWRLYRWAAMPPSPRARLAEWRQTLTALANGFEPRPSPVATFPSLITGADRGVREYPRFVASGIEFGNLTRRQGRTRKWRYLAVRLPAPLPHLVLDATANDGVTSDLPANVARGQSLTLEGGFERWFRVYTPSGYHRDALYVLTPDVMADLIDHAPGYNVEIVDRTLSFYAPAAADYGEAAHWESLHAMLTTVTPRIVVKAQRYLDDRVPGQEVPFMLTAYREERLRPSLRWVEPQPQIGPDGQRLTTHGRDTGVWSVLGAIGWYATLAFLYAVPAIFAFAGFMSIVDGF